ncbi:MAG: hypothetical protein IPP71_03330 [Bacteroidetes bacterium]|nr:hypothetical protein [Bacteroidota bacterium]
MKLLKNFLAGLVVSFIGSIPFGYLNILATKLLIDQGFLPFAVLVLGIITIEAIVIFVTLQLAQWLLSMKKLVFTFEVLTVVFLLLLAYNFYINPTGSNGKSPVSFTDKTLFQLFVSGVILSCLNFIQIPFWAGWNIYLVENNYLSAGNLLNLVFLSGALIGTTTGMYLFALAISQAIGTSMLFITLGNYYILPIIFILLAGIQVVKLIKKHKIAS